MDLTAGTETGPDGAVGTYGPNDLGYLCFGVRAAAAKLVSCSVLWSEGHYPHSNAKVMPPDHPIAKALAELATLDKEICCYANEGHDPALFEPYVPSEEAQRRWDPERHPGLEGADGIPETGV